MKLAQKIKKILKTKSHLIPSKLKKDNSPEKRRPDMKKVLVMRRLIITLTEGFKKQYYWYKEYYTK